jgi:hypothetical protein
MDKMMDVMYFGYEYEDDSRQFEIDFKKEIKEKFDNVDLRNAYDSIKGYRQEVCLDKDQKDNYQTWLIGKGWVGMSMIMQLMMLDKDLNGEFERMIDSAKLQYPEAFKKGA